MVPVNPGDVFRAEFAHLGPVTVRFSKERTDRGHHRAGDRRHLITSERERKGIAQFSDEHPDIPVETAFEAQKLFVQSKLDAGESFVGWKLGLTSRNKQQAMGSRRRSTAASPAACSSRTASRCVSTGSSTPRGVRDRVPAGPRHHGPATIASVLAATEVVFGAVDVLDSRYESFKFTLSDVVADNASAAASTSARSPAGPTSSRTWRCWAPSSGWTARSP
jgi:2-keto-4-pentenoate hydratase